jgi:hypothetical protein
MKLRDWKGVIIDDWPEIGEVTRRTIVYSKELASRGYRASMRVATGRVHVDRDYEAWREGVLATPLP